MTETALIAGVGMTAFGRFTDRALRDLAKESIEAALRDAGIKPTDVQAVFAGNCVAGLITGQEMIRGQIVLKGTGIVGVPVINVENACATGSTALHLAVETVRNGKRECVLALGHEKMTHPDKQRTFAALATAADVEATQAVEGRSIFMDFYAEHADEEMEYLGVTAEDYAAIAVKNREHGSLSDKAQFGTAITAEEVLASRQVAGPLTLLMCSPVSDGAAAAIVVSKAFAEQHGLGDVVRVDASVLTTGDPNLGRNGAIACAIDLAYKESGFGPEDLDVVEVHDAAAPSELSAYVQLGLAAPGEAGKFLHSGATRLGGRVPVNTSGGLLSRGHPIGATGLAQVVEIVEQLRGRCGQRQVDSPRVGLTHNNGGHLDGDAAAAAIHILSR